jgi:hypothetical protein
VWCCAIRQFCHILHFLSCASAPHTGLFDWVRHAEFSLDLWASLDVPCSSYSKGRIVS